MEKLIVLTTVYNCEKYLDNCLYTILNQDYLNWECYLLNDLSTDNSKQICEKYCKIDSRFKLINNDKKYYQTGNYDQIMRNSGIDGNSIAVEVDGDDYLPDSNVFSRVIQEYQLNKNLFITYGQFIYTDGRKGFASKVDIKNIRKLNFTASHLRTWKVFLWRKIKLQDLYFNEWYAPSAGDVFFMFPMLEMAGEKSSKFINYVNYVYNDINPENDHKIDYTLQMICSKAGRSKNSYNCITN